MRKSVTSILLVLGLLLALFFGFRMASQPTIALTRVIINIPEEDAASSLIRVAQTAGYFREQHIDADIRTFSTGKEALQDMLQNPQVDYAVAYDTPVVLAIGSGTALRLLTSLHTSTENIHLVFKGARPADPKTSLRGARIGVTPGTSAEYALSTYLLTLGLAAKDTHWVNLSPETMVQASTLAGLDGWSIWDPYHSEILKNLQQQQQAYWQPDIGYYRSFSFLISDTARTERHPELSIRMLRALQAAHLLYEQDRPRFMQLVSAFPGIGRDAQTLEKFLQESALELGLSNLMRQELVTEENYFCMHQMTCDDRAVERLQGAFVTDALQAVAPELVTIRRMP